MKQQPDHEPRAKFHIVIARMVALTVRTAPWGFVLFVTSSLLFTALLVADLHFVRVLVNQLPRYVEGSLDYRSVLETVIVLGTVSVLFMIMNGCANLLYEFLEKRVAGRMTLAMADKATRVDLVRFESSVLYDTIEKAANGCERSFSAMEAVVFSIIFHGGYFLFLGLYLVRLEPLLVLGIFASFLPVALSRYVRTSAFYRTEGRVAIHRRRMQHFEACMTDREYLCETRTADATSYFMGRYRASLAEYNRELWMTETRTAAIDLALKVLTLAGYVGVLLLLVHLLFTDSISAGLFGAVYFALANIFKWFEELFGRLGWAHESSAFAGNYFSYLAAPEHAYGTQTLRRDAPIALDGVRFTYPGADAPAVDGVSLLIPRGQTIAIVGRNGAGKTTLARLIGGLLAPDTGRVTIGDVDPRAASRESATAGLSAVFQRHQRYRLSLFDNVTISEPPQEGSDSGYDDPSTRARVDLVLDQAGLGSLVNRLESGVGTTLSKEFGGTELSGGEWQRVAIARGLYRSHDAIILDEPTAAIDPIEETRVFRAFVEASRGRTAVIVTHRLGSVRAADRIVVMDAGRVVEDGTHDALMSADGIYARMFRSQARWYDRHGDQQPPPAE
ncbi:MAG: ABC transporter ATP-binding protein [Spirochaetaceae bacterium]|nr:MAG: ABC transporter ATP-binding protein [Spirochaetaceae bacterium]